MKRLALTACVALLALGGWAGLRAYAAGGTYYLRGEQCGWGSGCPLYDDGTNGDRFAGDFIHSLSYTVNSPLESNDEYKFYRSDTDKWFPDPGANQTFDSTGPCSIYLLAQGNPYGITIADGADPYAAVSCDAAQSDFSPVSFLGNESFAGASESYVNEGSTIDLRVEVYANGLTNAGSATAGGAVLVQLEYRQWNASAQNWGSWNTYGTAFSFEQDDGANWQYLLSSVSFSKGIYELRASYTDWSGATGNTGSNTVVLYVSDATRTPHSIQVDGNLGDWRSNESQSGRDSVTNYLTWDERYVYVGWNGGGTSDKCIVGFDIDLGSSNDTVAYGGAAFPATGHPDYVLEYNKNTDVTYFFTRSGSSWGTSDTTGILAQEGSGPVCEARVPRSRLGGLVPGDDLGVVIYQSNWDSSWVFGASPVEGNSSGSALQYLNAQFHWLSTGSNMAPNAPDEGGRSEAALQPVSGGSSGSYTFGSTGADVDFPTQDDAPDSNCSIAVRVYENHVPPGTTGSVQRYYDITSDCSAYSADLTLSYTDGELDGNTESALDLWRWTGSAWEQHAIASGDRDTTNNRLTERDVTAFSRWVIDDNSPTAVSLLGFSGQAQRRGILLRWETASELDLVGFNLYRALRPDGPYLQLNSALIPAQHPGSPVGAAYSWLDGGVRAGRIYYYRLEQLSMAGEPILHGPIAVLWRQRVPPGIGQPVRQEGMPVDLFAPPLYTAPRSER